MKRLSPARNSHDPFSLTLSLASLFPPFALTMSSVGACTIVEHSRWNEPDLTRCTRRPIESIDANCLPLRFERSSVPQAFIGRPLRSRRRCCRRRMYVGWSSTTTTIDALIYRITDYRRNAFPLTLWERLPRDTPLDTVTFHLLSDEGWSYSIDEVVNEKSWRVETFDQGWRNVVVYFVRVVFYFLVVFIIVRRVFQGSRGVTCGRKRIWVTS